MGARAADPGGAARAGELITMRQGERGAMQARSSASDTAITLTVVIPSRDVGRYIGQLLTTLARTRRADFEFIFVDDHSTDGTQEIIEQRLPALPNARLIRLEGSGGTSAARNAGLAAASGRIVTFLDADDWISDGYLETAVELFDARNVDVMRFDHFRATGVERRLVAAPCGVRGKAINPRDYILPVYQTTLVDYPNVWAGLISRRFLEEKRLTFDESLQTAEDREWFWRIMLTDGSMSVENHAGYYYRRGVSNSLTQIGDARQLHYLDAMDSIVATVSADGDAERLLPKIWRTYLSLILFHLDASARLHGGIRRDHAKRVRKVLRNAPAAVLPQALVGMPRWNLGRLDVLGLRIPY